VKQIRELENMNRWHKMSTIVYYSDIIAHI